MAQPKTDYTYDINDELRMKVAFNQLVETERSAFWWGVVGTLTAATILRRRTNMPMLLRTVSAIFLGAQVYHFTSSYARDEYAKQAQSVNRKVTEDLYKIMKY